MPESLLPGAPCPCSLAQRVEPGAASHAERRQQAESEAGESGERDGDGQRAEVERRLARERQGGGNEATEKRDGERRQRQPGGSAGERERHALGHHLAHQALAAGAERGAHCELALTGARPREEKVGEVGAGEHEDAEARAAETEEHEPVARRHGVAEGEEAEAGVLVRLGIVAGEPLGDDGEIGARLLHRDAGLQASDALEVVVAAVLVIFFAKRQASPSLHVPGGEVEARRHHADHHMRFAVEGDASPDHRRIPPELRLPERVAEHQLPAVRFAGGIEHPAQQRRDPEQREHLGRDAGHREAARLARAHEVHLVGGERAQRCERRGHGAVVAEVRGRELVVAAPAAAGAWSPAEADQRARLGEGQRPEKHEVGHREGGRVGAHADRDDQDGGDGEPPRMAQRPERVAEVGGQQVAVDRQRVGHDVHDGGSDQAEPRDPPHAGAPLGEERAHLVAVVDPERGGVEAKERPVEPDHDGSGARRPATRASRTRCVSRRVSARATAVPKGVMR